MGVGSFDLGRVRARAEVRAGVRARARALPIPVAAYLGLPPPLAPR